MISRREVILAIGAGALSLPMTRLAQAQPGPGVHRIGFLAVRSRSTPSNPDVRYDAFVKGMHALGYVEGKNLIIEWRFADDKYERLPSLASEIVQANVEVIVTHATPPAKSLQRATRTIPIVAVALGDPVGDGFAASLARPGGNITGLSVITGDVSLKHLELLKEVVPALSRVAVVANPDNANHRAIMKNIRDAAQKVGVSTLSVEARDSAEIERGFAAMNRERAEGVLVIQEAIFTGQLKKIADLAIKYRLPAIYASPQFADAGGLMSYGQNITDLFRHAAIYVDKILKGAKPSELPFEQPTMLEMVVNRKTAKMLGLIIPLSVLVRADQVVE